MKRHLIIIGLCIGVLCVSVAAQEEIGRGRITGTVTDEAGAPLEGALVVAQSTRSETKLEGRSDDKGRFAIAGLGTGSWRVTASIDGYQGSSVEMSVRQLSQNPPISFTLKKLSGMAAFAADKEALALFDRGNTLLSQGNYDEALQMFEDFAAKHPEIYQVHLNIGTCYLKKEELEKAESEFKLVLDKVVEAHGDLKKDADASLRASTGLGEVFLRRGDFEAAQKYLAQAVDISPQDEAAAYNVGELLFSNQKIDEAIRYLELATQIKKDWPKPYMKLGYVYLNKGDFAKALENFNTFLTLDPGNPEAAQVKSIIETIEKMKK
ncbi:MAG TPA: tetratricopeptide repeat protein [Candidatus Desulfaltia sp.]|nr:tetratricopeptide repeat protein [Candidatus Desulfaltia sp.]